MNITYRTTARVRTEPDAEMEVPGRAGRTAVVQAVVVLWIWQEDESAWYASVPARVEQADRKKDGTLGTPYDRPVYPDFAQVMDRRGRRRDWGSLTDLVESTRPQVDVTLISDPDGPMDAL